MAIPVASLLEGNRSSLSEMTHSEKLTSLPHFCSDTNGSTYNQQVYKIFWLRLIVSYSIILQFLLTFSPDIISPALRFFSFGFYLLISNTGLYLTVFRALSLFFPWFLTFSWFGALLLVRDNVSSSFNLQTMQDYLVFLVSSVREEHQIVASFPIIKTQPLLHLALLPQLYLCLYRHQAHVTAKITEKWLFQGAESPYSINHGYVLNFAWKQIHYSISILRVLATFIQTDPSSLEC